MSVGVRRGAMYVAWVPGQGEGRPYHVGWGRGDGWLSLTRADAAWLRDALARLLEVEQVVEGLNERGDTE